MYFRHLSVIISGMEEKDVNEFLKEREARLGNPIIYRAYSTWFAEVGRERREFGLLVYSDGKTLVMEDFFRPAAILGYPLSTKREKEREENYVKLELMIPVEDITDVSYVSRASAERSIRQQKDVAKKASFFSLAFMKNATCFRTKDRTFFLELPSHKEFKKVLNIKTQEN